MKAKQFITIILIMACCLLYGCKKSEGSEVEADAAADNTTGAALTEDGEKCDTTTTENVTQTTESTESQATATPTPAANLSESWELIKEISPTEKKISSRYIGFYNENYGISTAKYGVVYYTEDGGETWTAGKNNSACIAGLEFVDDKEAVLTANNSQVRTSHDSGHSWEVMAQFGNMSNEHCRYISFIDKDTGWIANKKEIGYTTDGGLHWVGLNMPTKVGVIDAIWLSNADEGYFLNTDGILFYTADGGATWSEKDLGIKGLKAAVCPTAAMHVDDQQNFQIVACLSNKDYMGYYYFSTSDGGTTWDKEEVIMKAGQGFINMNREGTILTTTDIGTVKTKVYKFVEK